MNKVNLIKKLFGKQEKSCCTVKIEEVKDVKETKEVKEIKNGTDSCCNDKIEEVPST